MITVEHKKENDYYHIVDGQQRLTTIIILLKQLLDRFDDNDWIGDENNGAMKLELSNKYLFKKVGRERQTVKVVFGYEKDNPSDLFFRKNILDIETIEYYGTEINTLYTKNLSFAKELFQKKIETLQQNKIEVVIRKLTKQLKFNFYEIDQDDELDVSIIFETMNNRGKQLTTLELLKNRLMYLTTVLSNDEDEIHQLRLDINEVWKTVYEYIGKESNVKLEDDVFLKDHYRMYFGRYDRTAANPERDYLLKQYFTIHNVVANGVGITGLHIGYAEIKEYISNLQKAVVAYYKMLNPLKTEYDEEIKKWLSKINRLGFDTFKPLMMSILIDEQNNESRDIVKVLQYIENYMFIMFRTRKGSNATIKDFFEMAHEYHKNQYIYRIIDKLEQKILQGHKNKLFKVKKFLDIIEENFDDERKLGWYSWNGLQYLLYEYELYLQEQVRGDRKLEWEEINKESIEHIYPQNSTRECWEHMEFSNDKELKKMVHGLGNLVLLSKRYNSQLGNRCFEDKKLIYRTASYNTNEISRKSIWSQNEIYERGEKLLKFMMQRWYIDITEEEMAQLLP
jgi:uncharacterized protein with ParB-like and HNH nuclease domain